MASLPQAGPNPQQMEVFYFKSQLSQAVSLPGAELLLKNRTCFLFEQATCPGQLRCLGRICFSKTNFQEFWYSCAQNKTSEILKNGLSELLGLLCAEQHVGHLKNCTSRNSGTPVRRTTRRKSQQLHFQKFWDSCAQNNTSDISNTALP